MKGPFFHRRLFKKGRYAMKQPEFDNKFYAFLYKLNRVFGTIEEVLAIITLWALIAVCVVFISARFIFHIPTPWADELARYLLILLGWMGAAFASSNNDHLNIDIVSTVVQKYSKNPDKVLDVVDRISQALMLIFLVVFLYYYTIFVVKMYQSGTPSSTLPFDMYLPMSLILIGGGLVLIHSVCFALLPKKYWGKEIKDSAEDKKEA